MAYIVTEACIRCKFMDCIEVCPTYAFHAGANFVVINPDTCVNCGLCEMVCPTQAIKARGDATEKELVFVELNARLAQSWPAITQKGLVPADAENWIGVAGKKEYLLYAPDLAAK